MPVRKPSRYGNNTNRPPSSSSSRRPQGNRKTQTITASSLRATESTSQDEKLQAVALANGIDESMGFPRFDSGRRRIGWLYNMHSTLIPDPRAPGGHRAGVDFYFIAENGRRTMLSPKKEREEQVARAVRFETG